MAGLIPAEFLEELNRRLDVVEVVSQYVTLKKQGRNLSGLCPFHSEKTPSFSVAPAKQIYYCFGCHKGGNALNFIMEIDNLPFVEAVEKAAKMVGMEMPERESNPEEAAEQMRRKKYFQNTSKLSFYYKDQLWLPAGEDARQYLKNRGLTKEIVEKFELGFSPDWDSAIKALLPNNNLSEIEETGVVSRRATSAPTGKSNFFDKFHHRVIFPIHDYKGQVVAFGGRILGDGQPKYLNSPETRYFHKSDNLYGLSLAGGDIRKLDEVILMEGYMDVITAHQFDVTNVVASLGTAFNESHAKLLRRYSTNVIIAYDGDSAGVKATNKAMDVLKDLGFNIRVVHFPDNLDPDDFLRKFGKVGWEDLVRDHAVDFWRYKLDRALDNNNISNVTGKSLLMKELMPYIKKADNGVERESFVNLIAKTIGVSPENIYGDLSKTPAAAASADGLREAVINRQTEAIDRVRANLVLFMLHDGKVFDDTINILGENFAENSILQELVDLVQNIKDKYNWQPQSLFSHLEKGATYELLLKMVRVDLSQREIPKLAEGCITAIRIEKLQEELALNNKKLREVNNPELAKSLMMAIQDAEIEIRNLRNG